MIPATPRPDTRRDLTICTVSFHNAAHLIANWELAERLNGNTRPTWIVAENTPEGSHGKLAASDPRFRVIPGAEGRHRDNYHHTIALQKTLTLVDTRFMLVLDPDFYIVRPRWAEDVLEHMVASGLAMFGVPWHPRYIDKYRYFPCVHCFFIDLDKVPVSDLDFRPTCADAVDGDKQAPDRSTALGRLLDTLALRHRRKDYRDTGTRMFLRFAHDRNVKYECATPVYRLPEDFPGKGNPLALHSRLIEAVLPDSLCYVPKRRETFVRDGFLEPIRNSSSAHWEQFIWRKRPFGFHMRRNADKNRRDEHAELEALASVLRHFR
jgi:hypothetical protein